MSADEQPFPSVWTRPRRRRRPQPLSREQIVSEALRLLDAEGIDALSMRRLGTRLDAGATSLYSHVANKGELIELVVDESYGEIQVPDSGDPADWRASATTFAQNARSMILRHPWIVSVLGEVGLAYLGPNVMRLNDRMLGLFGPAGFTLDEASQAVDTLAAYVIGTAISEAAWLTMIARSGQNEQDWTERLRPAAQQAAQAYPRLREWFATRDSRDPLKARQENFAYGLERVLDGLEVRLSAS